LTLKDSCISQIKAQGPSRTCNESEEGYLLELAEALGAHGGRVEALLLQPPLLQEGEKVCGSERETEQVMRDAASGGLDPPVP